MLQPFISFVSLNIPLGINVYCAPSSTLLINIFSDMVINAIDTEARAAAMASSTNDDPNEGNDPWQMKTMLTSSIPVVEGCMNIFCDGFTAKTDLQDVANVDIMVGCGSSPAELSRLHIKKNFASTSLIPLQSSKSISLQTESPLLQEMSSN